MVEEEGVVVGDVADGEAEGYGGGEVGEGGEEAVDHGLHVGVVGGGPIVGEAADHEAADAREYAAQAQLPEDALYLIDGLGDVFDEEDGARADGVEGGADEAAEYSQISAYNGAFGLA